MKYAEKKKIVSMKKEKSNSGFTLIELMVVVSIIGILATFAIPQFTNVSKKAYDTKDVADMRTIKNAAQLYYIDHEGTNLNDLSVDTLVKEGYLDDTFSKSTASGNGKSISDKYAININEGKVEVTMQSSK